MQELINHLKEKAGITEEQAINTIHAVKDFVKEKFPMMAGAVDNLFGQHVIAPGTNAATATDTATSKEDEPSVLDKISDVIPGETGQKVEDFAKETAHKAEEAFDNVKEKLSGLFKGDKK